MEYLDMRTCLESMQVLVDSREQPGERADRRYRSFGCPWRRQTLNYGDYTYTFTLNGRSLFPEDVAIGGDCVIERKASLEELSGNFTKERDRFAREFQRARDANAKVYLLVENSELRHIYAGHYDTRFGKEAYFASLLTFMARYDITPIFCPADMSGVVIGEILRRELKERLEKGKYDEFC